MSNSANQNVHFPKVLIDEPGRKEMRDFIQSANLNPVEHTGSKIVFDNDLAYEIEHFGETSTYCMVNGQRQFNA